MSTFPGSPRLLKGGLVLVDAVTAAVVRIVPLQYNPESITRTLQAQSAGPQGGDRAEALRLTAPPVETITLEAEIDAVDALEKPVDNTPNQMVAQVGLHPQLAALETIIYPSSQQLADNDALAQAGTFEIAPALGPLTLFVWSAERIQPVRVTAMTITEEAFDPQLNPIRARVNLELRALSVYDLGFGVKGGDLYMAFQRTKESLAAKAPAGSFSALGIGGIA